SAALIACAFKASMGQQAKAKATIAARYHILARQNAACVIWRNFLHTFCVFSSDRSETEGGGKDRPPQVGIEAQSAVLGTVTEVEAAIADVQVPGWAETIIDRADDLPIGMGPDPEAAEIPIGGEPEAVAEVAVIARGDQRIDPAGEAARHRASQHAR